MNNENGNLIQNVRKFDIRDKIGYLFGAFGNEMIFDFVSAYLMVFYTDVFGISPALTGGLLVIARIWDAFMDITAGRFIDTRPNTPNGKFKPVIFRLCIPMFIFAILMFTKIPGLTGTSLIIYAFAAYILYGTIHSFVAIPYGASASVISTDSSERAVLSTFRTMGANIGKMLMNAIVPIIAFTGNKLDGNKTTIAVVAMSIFGACSYYAYYKLTTERLKVNNKKKLNIKKSVKGLVKNRPFISLVCLGFVLLFAITSVTTFNAYLYKDYFKNAKALSFNGIIIILNIVIIAPLVGPLSRRFGKKELASASLLCTSIGFFFLFLLPIKNAYIFVALTWIANAGMNCFAFMAWSFVSDVADYQELLVSQREDGTILSLYQYARKLGQSVAVGFVGVALSMIGYVKGGQQAVEVTSNIKNIATLAPAIAYFLVFLGITFWYPMSKKKLEQLQIDLEMKRAEDAKES